MDVLTALREAEGMLDLADRAAKLAADRRRALRAAQFHIRQEFGLAVDSLLIGSGLSPEQCFCPDGNHLSYKWWACPIDGVK